MTTVLWICAAVLVVLLAFVQLGSDAIFAPAASAHSLPGRIPLRTGEAVYSAIARVAPAPYAISMLARAALQRNDLDAARRYASALPASPRRDDLLGRIAQAAGDHRSAQRYFLAAGDIFAIGDEIDAQAKSDPRDAYELQMQLNRRLDAGGTHPDAVAEGYWRAGVLSSKLGRPARALEEYRHAVAISPISAKYLISVGFQAYDLRRLNDARRAFARAIAVDPCSADALAGAGMVALLQGDRVSAQTYAHKSGACDPHSHALYTLRQQLR